MCVRAMHIVCVVYVNMWHVLYIQHILITKINAIRGNVHVHVLTVVWTYMYVISYVYLSCPAPVPLQSQRWNGTEVVWWPQLRTLPES